MSAEPTGGRGGQVDALVFLRFDAMLKECYGRIAHARLAEEHRRRLQFRLARITERGLVDLPAAMLDSERFARELDRTL